MLEKPTETALRACERFGRSQSFSRCLEPLETREFLRVKSQICNSPKVRKGGLSERRVSRKKRRCVSGGASALVALARARRELLSVRSLTVLERGTRRVSRSISLEKRRSRPRERPAAQSPLARTAPRRRAARRAPRAPAADTQSPPPPAESSTLSENKTLEERDGRTDERQRRQRERERETRED